jgi:hypothetical protein
VRGIALICVLLSPVAAEQLPIRVYSSADGLPHNEIHMTLADARGFIWFCTTCLSTVARRVCAA